MTKERFNGKLMYMYHTLSFIKTDSPNHRWCSRLSRRPFPKIQRLLTVDMSTMKYRLRRLKSWLKSITNKTIKKTLKILNTQTEKTSSGWLFRFIFPLASLASACRHLSCIFLNSFMLNLLYHNSVVLVWDRES